MIFSEKQNEILERFKQGENLFISGPGGSGKTTLIKELIKSTSKNVQVCALTGCAAILLQSNAKTIHSWSGIKIAKGDKDKIIKNVVQNKFKSRDWRKTDILIIDEISMMSKRIFDLLNSIGKETRKNQHSFGNLQLVFVGDFYQLPPVTNDDLDSDKFCFESTDWFSAFPINNHIILTEIYRQKDKEYTDILMKIRQGSLDKKSLSILKDRVKKRENNNTVKLLPTKFMVDKINSENFNLIENQVLTQELIVKKDTPYYLDSNIKIDSNLIKKYRTAQPQQIDYEIQYLKNNSPLESTLCLKIGTRVMCIVNMDLENNICNGSQGEIVEFKENQSTQKCPVVKFDNGITRQIDIHYIQSEVYPNIVIGQFPLILAWAITIHKIQGSTLESAEIDVGNNVFEYGQTYVALSRVKSLDGLYLNSIDAQKIKANPKVVDFYKEVTNY